MEIRITLDETEPPVGRIRLIDDGRSSGRGSLEVRFAGWLGLLHALSEITGQAPPAPDE